MFILIYGLYGYLIDWTQFVQMLKTQSFRLLGWTNPAFLLSHPGFHQKLIMDFSYYLILVLGFASLLFKDSINHRFLSTAVFGSLILVWLTSAEDAMLGWYKLPFFVFLSITAGQTIKLKSKLPLFILLTITILNNYGLIRSAIHPFPEFWPFRFIVALPLSALFLLFLVSRPKPAIQKWLTFSLITLYILVSFYITDRYYLSTCAHQLCPLPILTLSQLLSNFPNFNF